MEHLISLTALLWYLLITLGDTGKQIASLLKARDTMGFRPALAVHTLTWPDGHMLHGLEVKLRSVTVEKYNEIMRLMLGERTTGQEAIDANEQLLAELAAGLKSWNYESPETGEPLPATRDGINKADSTHMTAIVAAWVSALVSVPGPLPMQSPNGNSPSDSAESALNLASVSASRPS